ncbi:hypothetical protein BH18ACT1_BH18ACT1_05250 [soil metagenome]
MALRTSLAAVVGSVTVLRVGFEFLVAAVGGVLVGLVVARLLVEVRRRVEDLVLDTTLSFLAPFIAFIAAEELSVDGAHPSGVLAVVITGLILGHRSTELQNASSRVAEQTNWRTVQYVLENGVFLLIGLQLATVLEDVADTGIATTTLFGICAAVLVTTVAIRLVWVYPATYLPRLIPAISRCDPAPPLTYPLVLGWAGMRGVVTLAAVFTVPASTPQQPVLVRLRERSFDRANQAWERLGPNAGSETPSRAYRRARVEMLAAERAALGRLRDSGRIDSEVLRGVQGQLDVEESLLDRSEDELDTSAGNLLRSAATEVCGHLTDAGERPVPDAPVCARCLEDGEDWVHLRMCLDCGNVACCDSSRGRHATAHNVASEHP